MVFSLSFVSNHPIVLGPNNTNLPKIFSIIAEGEMHEAIKHEDRSLKEIVKWAQTNRGLTNRSRKTNE